MDINKFLKSDKDIVIELDDGVEYIVDDLAIVAIKRGDGKIALVRLYDKEIRSIDVGRIKEVLKKDGVVNYLDKKAK